MLCLKKIIIGFGILSPVLLSVFFVSPSYAITDLVFNWTTDSSTPFYFCDNTSPLEADCSDFSYLIFSPGTQDSFAYFQLTLVDNTPSLVTYRFPKTLDFIISLSNIRTAYVSNSYGLRGGTFTLSDSLPGSSTPCPDPEPCPSCPIVPENPYDNKFDEIKNAIYIIPAVLLLLYFFFCVYNIIIKNSGVKS